MDGAGGRHLIERSKPAGIILTEEQIGGIVRSNDKQRFALSDDGTRIQASQGHSIQVDLALLDRSNHPNYSFMGRPLASWSRFVEKDSSG